MFCTGFVEERGELSGFIAMRPEYPIPSEATAQGFNFGHSMLGEKENPILHFAFEFYGHAIYNGLVSAGNPIIQAVITKMVETRDYFFFAISPDNTVTAFRSQLENENLAGLKTNQEKYKSTICDVDKYENTVKLFTKNPDPKGEVMQWVCRTNWDYLDLSKNRLELSPS